MIFSRRKKTRNEGMKTHETIRKERIQLPKNLSEYYDLICKFYKVFFLLLISEYLPDCRNSDGCLAAVAPAGVGEETTLTAHLYTINT